MIVQLVISVSQKLFKGKEIYLWGSNIKDADDLKSLKNLETICIYDTLCQKMKLR